MHAISILYEYSNGTQYRQSVRLLATSPRPCSCDFLVQVPVQGRTRVSPAQALLAQLRVPARVPALAQAWVPAQIPARVPARATQRGQAPLEQARAPEARAQLPVRPTESRREQGPALERLRCG